MRNVRLLLFGIIFSFLSICAFGIDLSIDQQFVGAAEGVPHWLKRMRWGTVQENLYQSITGVEVREEIAVGAFRFQAEADLQATLSSSPVGRIRELYAAIGYGPLFFRAGVFRQTLGYTAPVELSSGSMSVSGNAAPVPRLQLFTPGFVPLPFTDEILAFSGGLSHGWLTGERAVTLPLLHEKWLYMQLQRKRVFRARFGLIHHAQWGGQGTGTVPATFDNYWRVFFARSGGADASQSDQINRVGNALGTWDANFTLFFDSWEITLYRHFFFEDGDAGFTTFDIIENGLSGVQLAFTESRLIQTIVFETLWTRYQSGEHHDLGFLGRPDFILSGRDSYYDHGAYLSGWTHRNDILGTSLFETTGKDGSLRIASNRVIAWHTGIAGTLAPRLLYRVLSTLTQHYPAYAPATLVTEQEKLKLQWYHYLGVTLKNPFGIERVDLSAGLAFDHGRLFGERYGAELTLRYDIF